MKLFSEHTASDRCNSAGVEYNCIVDVIRGDGSMLLPEEVLMSISIENGVIEYDYKRRHVYAHVYRNEILSRYYYDEIDYEEWSVTDGDLQKTFLDDARLSCFEIKNVIAVVLASMGQFR